MVKRFSTLEKKLAKLQLQILTELQLQNLHQTFCSKSEQKFSFLTKPQLPNLQQIVANTILTINICNRISMPIQRMRSTRCGFPWLSISIPNKRRQPDLVTFWSGAMMSMSRKRETSPEAVTKVLCVLKLRLVVDGNGESEGAPMGR